ncbi:MAG: tRNA pseudouridine(55) synthase TruB [Oscillospiraceae bacterium]|nr:tRNA pseudouridine(55) synthase TruB [Oscillospiraceae bacterium]
MNGIINIDKPADWTSNDVVCKLKGVLHERRIGHGGTLDPMATGVLPVFVGRATRAVEFCENARKRYIAGLRLGIVTDTQDTTGTVLEEKPVSATVDDVRGVLSGFTGDIQQLPPMYSAIKVGGRKLYDLARKGIEVERSPRPVTIYAVGVTQDIGGEFTLDVTCSKGTYIRTLCHDIGQALGCGGVMSSLRRVQAGSFSIENAYPLAQVIEMADRGDDSFLLGTDSLFAEHPAYTADAGQERRCRNGNDFSCSAPDGVYRVYSKGGEFLMLGKVSSGVMTTVKSFFTPPSGAGEKH